MKKLNILMLVALFFALTFFSCNKNDDDNKSELGGVNNCISGVFSVSDNKKINFSKGNLQLNMETKQFQFAEHQWDYVGNDGDNIIDLFELKDGNPIYSINNENTVISDAEWDILSQEEWEYLIDRDKKSKYGVAEVNGVQGLVLLPDDWVSPEGVTFNIGVAIGMDSKYYKTKNLLSLVEWTKMEAAGAVFLPAAGYRIETDILFDGDDGYYLSSTAKNTDEMCLMVFNSGRIRHDIVSSNDAGYSVRFVHVL